MTRYLTKNGEEYSVISAIGFTPKNSMGVVPNSVSPEDYPYVRYRDVVDPETEETHREIYVDEDLKSTGDAQKQQELEDKKWVDMRAMRDQKLKESDFTQLSDAPLTSEKKTEYTAYRQELRDLPDTIQDIDSFVWPVRPE